MAVLKITEYASGMVDAGRAVSAGQEPAETVQAVTFSAAVTSAAFSGETRLVRLKADAKAYIKFSKPQESTPADANSTELEANSAEYFGVYPGYVVSVYDGVS